jgi:hypothetical protein
MKSDVQFAFEPCLPQLAGKQKTNVMERQGCYIVRNAGNVGPLSHKRLPHRDQSFVIRGHQDFVDIANNMYLLL